VSRSPLTRPHAQHQFTVTSGADSVTHSTLFVSTGFKTEWFLYLEYIIRASGNARRKIRSPPSGENPVDHDQLQTHVEQLFEQSSPVGVAQRAVGVVETAFDPSAVGFYDSPDEGSELLASTETAQSATETTLPSSLAGVSAVDRAVDTGAPVTGTPPSSLSRHESWCCVSTGGEGVLVAADPTALPVRRRSRRGAPCRRDRAICGRVRSGWDGRTTGRRVASWRAGRTTGQ